MDIATETARRIDIGSIPFSVKFSVAYAIALNDINKNRRPVETIEEVCLSSTQTQDTATEHQTSFCEALDDNYVQPYSPNVTIKQEDESVYKPLVYTHRPDLGSVSTELSAYSNDCNNHPLSQEPDKLFKNSRQNNDNNIVSLRKRKTAENNAKSRKEFIKKLRPRRTETQYSDNVNNSVRTTEYTTRKKLQLMENKRKAAERAFSDSSPDIETFKEGAKFTSRCSIEFWKKLIKMQCDWLRTNATKTTYSTIDKGFILNCWNLITRHYFTVQHVNSSDTQTAATVFLSNCIKMYELAISHGCSEISTIPIEFVQKIVKKFFLHPRWMDKYNIKWVYVREAFHIIFEHPNNMETLLSLYAAMMDTQTRVINILTTSMEKPGKRSAEMTKNFLCFVIGEISSFITVLNQRIQQKNRAVTFNLNF